MGEFLGSSHLSVARLRVAGVFGSLWLGLIAPAWGVVSVSYQTDPSQGAYSVSSSDLINSNSLALLGSTHTGYTPFTFDGGTSTTAALNDGVQGVSYAAGNGALSSGAFDIDGVWTSTFFLNAGYNLTEIDTIASWPAARASQAYTVSVRQVGNVTFTPVTVIDFLVNPDQSSKIVITDTGGTLAANVDAIRFDFTVASGAAPSPETVYRELDVFGTLVPEPSSLSLLALGGAALLLRRLRKH